MKVTQTAIEGVIIIEPDVFSDTRGWFYESFSAEKFAPFGITAVFVQDNHAYSEKKGTLRGLHYQKAPFAQSKLVRCTHGAVLDVAADIRRGLPTYGKWVSVTLSAENKKMIYVPAGFAHGYITLTDDAEVLYKVDAYYSPEHDRGVRFDDPELAINWGELKPILSDKDKNAPFLRDADNDFVWEER